MGSEMCIRDRCTFYRCRSARKTRSAYHLHDDRHYRNGSRSATGYPCHLVGERSRSGASCGRKRARSCGYCHCRYAGRTGGADRSHNHCHYSGSDSGCGLQRQFFPYNGSGSNSTIALVFCRTTPRCGFVRPRGGAGSLLMSGCRGGSGGRTGGGLHCEFFSQF